ncbi:MAG: ABC transporter substrate-binding protein [Xanthobacteraceae bacterium]|jgi:NitT/TauT family transport system substrate-binding protein
MQLTRRHFASLTLLGTGSLLTFRPTRAWAATEIPIEKMRVAVGNVPSFVYAGFYVGLDRGYFAARGLEVELVITRGGDAAFQVAGNTLQFAGGSPDSAFFNGLARGLPLMPISSLAANPTDRSSNILMVRKDLVDSGAVTKVADLKARKVANLVPGGITEYLLALHLRTGGLTVDEVDMIAPLGFPQMVDALTTKAVDAALLAEPFATMAINKGVAAVLDDKGDVGEQILWIQTNRDFAKENSNVVVNFLIGFLQAARDIARETFHGPKILAIIEKYTKVPADIIAQAAPPLIPPNGELNIKSIMAQQDYHMSRGKLTYKDPIPAANFVNTSFLDRALEYLGRYPG